MLSEYFKAVVERVVTEPQEVRTIVRSGFLCLRKTVQVSTEYNYFILCKITDTDFLFKIKVGKEVYDQASIGSCMAVRLEFKYKYSCFFFLKSESKENIIEVVG